MSWINLRAQIPVPITLINSAGNATQHKVIPWQPIFWCFCRRVRLLNFQSGDWKLTGYNTGNWLGYKNKVMFTRSSLTKKVPCNHLVQGFVHIFLIFSGFPIFHNLCILQFLLLYCVLRMAQFYWLCNSPKWQNCLEDTTQLWGALSVYHHIFSIAALSKLIGDEK